METILGKDGVTYTIIPCQNSIWYVPEADLKAVQPEDAKRYAVAQKELARRAQESR